LDGRPPDVSTVKPSGFRSIGGRPPCFTPDPGAARRMLKKSAIIKVPPVLLTKEEEGSPSPSINFESD
jgi:hypothetical protein